MGALGNFFQSILDGFSNALDGLINLFPESPFQGIQQLAIDHEIFGVVNWLIPIDAMVSLLSGWVVAIGVYYAWSVIARWVKMISG